MNLTEQQIDLIDDALEHYFGVHLDNEDDNRDTADLHDLITDTRTQLAQSLPCSECGKPRMGYHSDLCSECYLKLTRGELKVKV